MTSQDSTVIPTPLDPELAAQIVAKALEPDLDTPTAPNDLPAESSKSSKKPLGRTVISALAKAAKAAGPMVGALLGGLVVWYGVTYLLLDPDRRFLLPPPHQVLTNTVLDIAKMQPMFEALALTARVAMTGLAIAILLGISLAVAMSQG